VIIPPGQATLTFPIAVVENEIADGAHVVALGGSIREPGTGIVVGQINPTILNVTDNDGPTLTVALDAEAVGEGLNPATVGTVTRNSSTANPLTVQLSSSNTNEATVPVSVVIPAGATSVAFPINSRTDGTNDGSQSLTVTASAAGFTSGSGAADRHGRRLCRPRRELRSLQHQRRNRRIHRRDLSHREPRHSRDFRRLVPARLLLRGRARRR
jgi:hypothetical protein